MEFQPSPSSALPSSSAFPTVVVLGSVPDALIAGFAAAGWAPVVAEAMLGIDGGFDEVMAVRSLFRWLRGSRVSLFVVGVGVLAVAAEFAILLTTHSLGIISVIDFTPICTRPPGFSSSTR